jgi:seryl-tRNA synthetase
MADQFSRAREFASAKWSDVSETVGTQRKMRGLRNEITELVRTRDRLMSDMGHKVFALYSRGKVRNADLLAVCERIDEVNGDIDELNRQVQELAKPRPRGEVEEVELEDETELVDEAAEPEEEPGEEEEEADAEAEAADEDSAGDEEGDASEPSDESADEEEEQAE